MLSVVIMKLLSWKDNAKKYGHEHDLLTMTLFQYLAQMHVNLTKQTMLFVCSLPIA